MKKAILVGLTTTITLFSTQPSFTPNSATAESLESTIKESNNDKTKDLYMLKDIDDHWASTAIHKAFERGYASGYSDFTFRPNKEITRAEFLKMVVLGIGIDTSTVDKGSKWFDPFFNVAIKEALITTQEYQSGNYNNTMTRMEMARLAVHAIGLTAKSDEEYMYLATSTGLISGVGNGKLAVNGTTNRAQAVVIIERIITVRNGGTLSVDHAAIKAAEQAMNAPKDPWGSEIRTTNLPSNANNFPYILKKWPNEMYGLKVEYTRSFTNAADFVNHRIYSLEAANYWADTALEWGNLILNVDHKTIGNEWAEKYMKVVLNQSAQLKINTNKYVNWVKENQIQIEGSFTVEPSIIQLADGKILVRSYFRFKINNYKVDNDIIHDLGYKPEKYKKNQWYSGYADISLVNNVYNGTYKNYKVASLASIFRQGTVKEE